MDTSHIIFAVVYLLGCCWIGWFNHKTWFLSVIPLLALYIVGWYLL